MLTVTRCPCAAAVRHRQSTFMKPYLVASLLCVLLSSVSGYDLAQFAHDSVKGDTGFEQATLQHVWNKYNAWQGAEPGTFASAALKLRERKAITRAWHFYCLFVWIHKYPVGRWTNTFTSRDGQFKMALGSSLLYDEVIPIGDALAEIISEVDYTWRWVRAIPKVPPHTHSLPSLSLHATLSALSLSLSPRHHSHQLTCPPSWCAG